MEHEDTQKESTDNNLQKINQRMMKQVKELEAEVEAIQDYVNKQAIEHESVKEILFASEERLRTVISSAPRILFAIDKDGVVIFAEGKGIEALGFDAGLLIGRSFAEFFPGIAQIIDDVKRVLEGESFDSIIEIDNIWIEVKYSPIRNLEDGIEGAVCVARDITDLIQAKGDKLEKEKLKGVLEMAAAVSHEINQPLQMIATNKELLELYTKKEQSKKLIKAIENAVERMTKITRRLSSITKYKTMSYTNSTNIIDIYKASR